MTIAESDGRSSENICSFWNWSLIPLLIAFISYLWFVLSISSWGSRDLVTSPLPELPVPRAGPSSSGMMRSKVPCLLEEMFTMLVWKAICKYAFSIPHDICGKTYFRLGLKKMGKNLKKNRHMYLNMYLERHQITLLYIWNEHIVNQLSVCVCVSCSVMSNSLWPHEL